MTTPINEPLNLLRQAQFLIDSLVRELPDEERFTHWLVKARHMRRNIAEHIEEADRRQSSDQSSDETRQSSDPMLVSFGGTVLCALDALGPGGEIRIRHQPVADGHSYNHYEVTARTDGAGNMLVVMRNEIMSARFDLLAETLRRLTTTLAPLNQDN